MKILIHHGIKGQKWGIRRYQNDDGTLTEEGRRRLEYASKKAKKFSEEYKEYARRSKKDLEEYKKKYSDKNGKFNAERYLDAVYGDDWKDPDYMKPITDVKKHAKYLYDDDLSRFEEDYKTYISEAKEWERSAKQYMEITTLDDIDDWTLSDIEWLADKYLESMK